MPRLASGSVASRFLAEQHAQEGRFAAARCTHQRAELALFDVHPQVFQHHLIAVGLPQIAYLDVAHARPPSYQGKAARVRRFRPKSISQASSVIQAT